MSKLRDNPMIQLVDEVTRLQGRLQLLFAGVRDHSGLGSTDNLVLAAILESDAAPTVPQIGRSLGHPRQVIQRSVNKLEEAGLIAKSPNPAHKRAPLLIATPRGTKLKQRADRLALESADAFLAAVDRQQVADLAGELREARRALETYLRGRQ